MTRLGTISAAVVITTATFTVIHIIRKEQRNKRNKRITSNTPKKSPDR